MVLARSRLPLAPALSAEIDRPRPISASVCFNCFRHFRGMLQLFHMDVAKVNQGILHMLNMLQVFQRHVASVCSKCFICFQTMLRVFLSGCCICFHTYVATICSKIFYLFQSSVAASVFMLQVASVLSGCCIYFHTYVASVYYICFIYFRRMLH